MNAILIGAMMLGFMAETAPATTAFEFRDEMAFDGRSMAAYQAIGFKSKPVRELAAPFDAPKGARFALLPLGAAEDHSRTLVWAPDADGGPVLWIDADGDGRLDESERHVMTGREIEVPVSVVVETKPEVRVERTLIFQRPVIGPGLRWTVRGYAVGKLDLDGEPYDAILADGNANVTFGTIGRDRVWIDLNRDGRFDALTEQFPLGKPIRKGERIYVVRSNRRATKVSAVAREPGEGKIRLELAHDMKVEKVSAELISDLGELVEIDSIDQATPVPHGSYYIASLVIKTAGDDGQPWFYTFSGKNRKRHDVAIGDEATVALLDGLDMRVEIGYSGKNEAKPGETVRVGPQVVTSDGSLVLKSCTVGSEDSRSSTEAAAVILFLSPEGETLSRGTSGFG